MPPKGKPDTAGYQKMKKDLAGKNPGQLYIFHGEETYLRDHYLGKLRELLLAWGNSTSTKLPPGICLPTLWRRRWTACP